MERVALLGREFCAQADHKRVNARSWMNTSRRIGRAGRAARVGALAFLLLPGLLAQVQPGGATIPPSVPTRDLSKLDAWRVRSIKDGESLLVERDGKTRSVRLLGIQVAAPEADLVEAALDSLLRAEHVYLDFQDGSATRRDAAYVFRAPDGLLVNLELVRQGLATVAPQPKFALLAVFQEYEKHARENGRGLWRPVGPPATADDGGADRPASAVSTVYVTAGGKRYHASTCSFAKNAIPITLADARNKGYDACSRCQKEKRNPEP
jgi:endonuclease YncB( thermonuclease family)